MLHNIVDMNKPNQEQFDLPPVWKKVPSPIDRSDTFLHKQKNLFVVASIDTMGDGEHWLHLSVSKGRSQPTFADLQMVKNHFMGQEATAIQFFPPESKMVDITDAYHLWNPVRGKVNP